MMTLYFRNSKGGRRVIGNPTTEEDADSMITRFCDEHNFVIYYTRSWTTPDGEKWYDVGSHTEFFILVEE